MTWGVRTENAPNKQERHGMDKLSETTQKSQHGEIMEQSDNPTLDIHYYRYIASQADDLSTILLGILRLKKESVELLTMIRENHIDSKGFNPEFDSEYITRVVKHNADIVSDTMRYVKELFLEDCNITAMSGHVTQPMKTLLKSLMAFVQKTENLPQSEKQASERLRESCMEWIDSAKSICPSLNIDYL